MTTLNFKEVNILILLTVYPRLWSSKLPHHHRSITLQLALFFHQLFKPNGSLLNHLDSIGYKSKQNDSSRTTKLRNCYTKRTWGC